MNTGSEKAEGLDNWSSWTRQKCQCFVAAKCLNLNVINDLTFLNEENIGGKNDDAAARLNVSSDTAFRNVHSQQNFGLHLI